jgi:hypothetical protein
VAFHLKRCLEPDHAQKVRALIGPEILGSDRTQCFPVAGEEAEVAIRSRKHSENCGRMPE